MMKKYFGLLVIILTSCTSHKGILLEQGPKFAERRIVKDQSLGYSKAYYFMGLGRTSRNTLLAQAKSQLHYNVNMQPNQILENISIDYKYFNFLFYQSVEVFVTADVVEYPDLPIHNTYSFQDYQKIAKTLRKAYIFDLENMPGSLKQFLVNSQTGNQYYSLNFNQLNNFNNELAKNPTSSCFINGFIMKKQSILHEIQFFYFEQGEVFKITQNFHDLNFMFYTTKIDNNKVINIEGKTIIMQEENKEVEYTLLGMNEVYCLIINSEGKQQIGETKNLKFKD